MEGDSIGWRLALLLGSKRHLWTACHEDASVQMEDYPGFHCLDSLLEGFGVLGQGEEQSLLAFYSQSSTLKVSSQQWLVSDIFNEQGGFCCPSSESSFLPSYLILLLRKVFWSKLLNPVLRHLISAISLPFEIGILIFSEVPLSITGRSLQRASSGEERLHGRKGRWSNDFPKGIFTLWGIPCWAVSSLLAYFLGNQGAKGAMFLPAIRNIFCFFFW